MPQVSRKVWNVSAEPVITCVADSLIDKKLYRTGDAAVAVLVTKQRNLQAQHTGGQRSKWRAARRIEMQAHFSFGGIAVKGSLLACVLSCCVDQLPSVSVHTSYEPAILQNWFVTAPLGLFMGLSH